MQGFFRDHKDKLSSSRVFQFLMLVAAVGMAIAKYDPIFWTPFLYAAAGVGVVNKKLETDAK